MPGRSALLARRIALGAAVPIAMALTLAACGSASPSPAASSGASAAPPTVPDSGSPPPGPSSGSAAPATGSSRPTGTNGPTLPPTATPSPVASGTAPPTAVPSASVSPTTGGSGPAAACSGTPANRDFFAAVAQGVPWQVYCAVLPDGWFVDNGNYRLGGGGRLTVSYKGPGGARLTLQEGAFCTSGVSACSPRDREIGTAAFGDRTGTLVTLGPNQPGDGYALYVAPGAAQSWSATATNVDQAAFQAITAAFARVGP